MRPRRNSRPSIGADPQRGKFGRQIERRGEQLSLIHILLQVLEADAVPLEEGEYYLYQLVGLDVFTEAGTHLGRLSEVLETGANNVFVVNGDNGQHLLPDIPDVIKAIDIEHGKMTIHPMPGLIDGLDE